MGLTVVRTIPIEKWHHFVDEHTDSNIFHTPEMFEVFERTEGYQPTLWATVDDDNRPLALLLPVNITLIDGPLRRLTTRSVVYGGVLYAPNSSGEDALRLLLETYTHNVDKNILFTELRNVSDMAICQPILDEYGFVYEEHLNFLIDLDSYEEMWQRLSKSARQSVQTAPRKGTTIEEVTERDKISYAYEILQEAYSRAHVPLSSPTLFESAFDVLGPKQMCKIFLAQADGQYIGARVILAYNNRVTAWYATAKRAFSKYRPSELMVWHVMEWGQENQFQIFDFGGAGKPDEDYGPRDFKAKFGGDLVNYGRNICVHSPHLLKLSRVGYQLARKFL
jgi:hypothetical protein